jgi:Ca2+-binding RTX toxin-like protein
MRVGSALMVARMQPRTVLVVSLSAMLTTLAVLAAVAFAAHWQGTAGDDSFVMGCCGGNTADLEGGNDSFVGAPGIKGEDDEWGGGDHVHGGPDNDDITGRTYVDILRGQGGNDTLDGGRHRDGVYGGRGDDTLIGGANVDLFKPGKGEDTCIGQRKDSGFPGRCEHVQFTGK